MILVFNRPLNRMSDKRVRELVKKKQTELHKYYALYCACSHDSNSEYVARIIDTFTIMANALYSLALDPSLMANVTLRLACSYTLEGVKAATSHATSWLSSGSP